MDSLEDVGDKYNLDQSHEGWHTLNYENPGEMEDFNLHVDSENQRDNVGENTNSSTAMHPEAASICLDASGDLHLQGQFEDQRQHLSQSKIPVTDRVNMRTVTMRDMNSTLDERRDVNMSTDSHSNVHTNGHTHAHSHANTGNEMRIINEEMRMEDEGDHEEVGGSYGNVETDSLQAAASVSMPNNHSTSTHPHTHLHPLPAPPPRRSSSTRKQLIERERQARLERERARLKRQIALSREREEEERAFEEAEVARVGSSDGGDIGDIDIGNDDLDRQLELMHVNMNTNIGEDSHGHELSHAHEGVIDDDKSLVCTVGDGIGHDDDLNIEDNHESNDVIGNDYRGTENDHAHAVHQNCDNNHGNSLNTNENINGAADTQKSTSPLGFTMERFLQDGILNNGQNGRHAQEITNVQGCSHGHTHTPISVPESTSNLSMEAGGNHSERSLPILPTEDDAAVEIDMDAGITSAEEVETNLPVNSGINSSENAPFENEEQDHDPFPRLAQLTEAEILEMTEIDYASVGNMPPRSLRDEQHLPDISGMSTTSFDQTHTTAQESDTSAGPGSTRTRTSSMETGMDMNIGQYQNQNCRREDENMSMAAVSPISNVARLPIPMESFVSPTSASNMSVLVQRSDASIESDTDTVLDRKPAAVVAPSICSLEEDKWPKDNGPDIKVDEPKGLKWVDDKDSQDSPRRSHSDNELNIESLIVDSSVETYNLPNRKIRPGMINVANVENHSTTSKGHRRAQTTPNIPSFVDGFDYCKYDVGDTTGRNMSPFFGSDLDPGISLSSSNRNGNRPGSGVFFSYGSTDPEEGQALLISKIEDSGRLEARNVRGMDEMVGSVFSSVRSMSTADFQAEMNDCDRYSSSPAFSRACSDRFLPLVVTVVIEIPALIMIAGGSNRLCALIGRTQYQLLLAFLPLSSAISGNCGLQASTVAERAISHLHVTKENYIKWMLTEIQVAAILGLGMGLLIGTIGFQASGLDFAFGFTIFVANFVCILTSGLIGTLAPLIFTFIFHRDAGKWKGLLATAFQDVIASFTMVIFSFHLLLWLRPAEVEPEDLCGTSP